MTVKKGPSSFEANQEEDSVQMNAIETCNGRDANGSRTKCVIIEDDWLGDANRRTKRTTQDARNAH